MSPDHLPDHESGAGFLEHPDGRDRLPVRYEFRLTAGSQDPTSGQRMPVVYGRVWTEADPNTLPLFDYSGDGKTVALVRKTGERLEIVLTPDGRFERARGNR